MADITTKGALLALVVILVLVFVAQLVVGVLATANAQVNKTLVAVAPFGATYATTASANAINDSAANTITLTLSGSYSWISATHPLTISITGNQISPYASNTAYATPTNALTLTYRTTSNATTQTMFTNQGFYNITQVKLSGVTGFAVPSITATVSESFLGVAHGSAPETYATNTITAKNVSTITSATAVQQFDSTGTANTTVINFIPIVVLVALIVIILALFGLRNLLNVGEGEGAV